MALYDNFTWFDKNLSKQLIFIRTDWFYHVVQWIFQFQLHYASLGTSHVTAAENTLCLKK